MASYASVEKVEAGFRELDSDETDRCEALLEEAAIIIDSFNPDAEDDVLELVSCRMVRRALGDGESFPMGATQGTMTAGPYSQTFNFGSNGTSGELYVSKAEKRMLGIGSKIGAYNPLEELSND